MTIGTVKFFNTSKGFGFISPEGGGKDVFVHAHGRRSGGYAHPSEGQKVSFDVVPDARGAKAANLRPSKPFELRKTGGEGNFAARFVLALG